MKLWVMRHSVAGQVSTDPEVERDRPLTDEGVEIAEAIAKGMKDADEIPLVIFASCFVRTQETADIVGKLLKVPVDLIDELAPHLPITKWVMGLIENEDMKRVMIVGHHDNLEPCFEELGDGEVFDELVKGEVRRLDIDRDTGEWTEEWRLRPTDVGLEDDV